MTSPIRRISETTIQPTISHDDEFTQRVIELTPWDLRLIQLDHIQRGLLFGKSPHQQLNHNLINHLKSSLSLTLNIFYPLAGRLDITMKDEDQPGAARVSINCNGQGAYFVHAAAEGVKVGDILDSAYVPDCIVDNLFSMNGVINYEGMSKPLLAVQITELVDGIFIGCTVNHAVVDGTSFWHFFNTWSEISRSDSNQTTQLRPVFSRQFLNGLIDLPIHIPFSKPKIRDNLLPRNSPQPDSLQRYFHFPKQKIAQLKSKANGEMGTNHISSLQSLMAHLWRAITRCANLNPNQETMYVVAVGLRQRLKPPLPKEYLGNAVLGVVAKSTAGELLQNGLGWAGLRINNAIASLTDEQAKNHLKNWGKNPALVSRIRDTTSSNNGSSMSLITGSSPRFDVYGNDFGWGRPVAVRGGRANRANGKLTVSPGAEEGSIDFEVYLLRETLLALVKDEEFMEAVDT